MYSPTMLSDGLWEYHEKTSVMTACAYRDSIEVDNFIYLRFAVFTAVTMKNVVLWYIKPQFVLHRRHIKSPLQSPAG
jgi:hypothetical protein